jgi:hypothetical protein
MAHTPEYYESQIERLKKDRDSWKQLARFQIGTAGHSTEVELLRADRDRWKMIASARANELLDGYMKAETSV